MRYEKDNGRVTFRLYSEKPAEFVFGESRVSFVGCHRAVFPIAPEE